MLVKEPMTLPWLQMKTAAVDYLKLQKISHINHFLSVHIEGSIDTLMPLFFRGKHQNPNENEKRHARSRLVDRRRKANLEVKGDAAGRELVRAEGGAAGPLRRGWCHGAAPLAAAFTSLSWKFRPKAVGGGIKPEAVSTRRGGGQVRYQPPPLAVDRKARGQALFAEGQRPGPFCLYICLACLASGWSAVGAAGRGNRAGRARAVCTSGVRKSLCGQQVFVVLKASPQRHCLLPV
jgi:hypothetical protein